MFRELLAGALAGRGGIKVVGGVPGDIAAIALGVAQPDLVLADITSVHGAAGIRALAAAAPGAKIVALGIPEDEGAVPVLAEAGVAGYATAEQSLDDLVAAVDAAAHGELHCSPRVSAVLMRRVTQLAELAGPRAGSSADFRLTPRQREIAALIAEGQTNKQIARRLSIEQATVKNHVHDILAKLRVTRRGDVATLLRASK